MRICFSLYTFEGASKLEVRRVSEFGKNAKMKRFSIFSFGTSKSENKITEKYKEQKLEQESAKKKRCSSFWCSFFTNKNKKKTHTHAHENRNIYQKKNKSEDNSKN